MTDLVFRTLKIQIDAKGKSALITDDRDPSLLYVSYDFTDEIMAATGLRPFGSGYFAAHIDPVGVITFKDS